jgi:hypothetical protein
LVPVLFSRSSVSAAASNFMQLRNAVCYSSTLSCLSSNLNCNKDRLPSLVV